MSEEQSMEEVPVNGLLDKVRSLRELGYRPVQISATRFPDRVELTYSFDRDGRLLSLRVQLAAENACVPSISSVFGCVILYENELHDLFNIQVQNMAVDFHGKLYQTAVKFPFGTVRAPAKPTAAPKPPETPAASAKPAATA
jgi:ech hydrogenase subunit D